MRTKWASTLVLDQLDVAGFCVEDEDRADFLIGDIEIVLGIDGHAVGLAELEKNFVFSAGRSACRRGGPSTWLSWCCGLPRPVRVFCARIERLVADARHGRRIRPDDVRVVDDRNFLGRRRRSFSSSYRRTAPAVTRRASGASAAPAARAGPAVANRALRGAFDVIDNSPRRSAPRATS